MREIVKLDYTINLNLNLSVFIVSRFGVNKIGVLKRKQNM